MAPLGEPTRSPTQAAPQLPLKPAGPQPQLFIAVYSAANGAKYAAKRAANRAECAAHYREHGVPYRFFVGEPLADSRDWDEPSEAEAPAPRWTRREAELSAALLREAAEHRDMHVVRFRDVYRDLSNKMLAVLRAGAAPSGYLAGGADAAPRYGYRYVAKVDDEYCIDVPQLLGELREHEKRFLAHHDEHDTGTGQELYLGSYICT